VLRLNRGVRLIGFDTAGPVVGVAAADGLRFAERAVRVARGTEGVLPALVEAVLAEVDLSLGALDAVVVAVGPGAFTGLRVGISAATALALAVGLPVVAVDSLTSRALAAGFGPEPSSAWLDARKGRVYASRWDAEGTLQSGPLDVPPEVALAGCAAPFRVTGEGALVYQALIERAGGTVHADAADPGLRGLLQEGARRFAAGEGRDPGEVAPLYVRAPDVGG
jgi:tRNA threonylcarbamoyladenosine biosynthesis protein TsaB